MNYIYSTLTCDNLYVIYEKGVSDLPQKVASVLIKGGSNLSKVVGDTFFTPKGVMTAVSDEDLEILQKNEVFKLHVKNGFITIDAKKMDIEKAIVDNVKKDNSAPFTPEDYINKNEGALPSDVKSKKSKN